MKRAKSIVLPSDSGSFDSINSFLKEIQSQTEFPLLKELDYVSEGIIGCAILDRSQLESISFTIDRVFELALLPKLGAQTQLKEVKILS